MGVLFYPVIPCNIRLKYIFCIPAEAGLGRDQGLARRPGYRLFLSRQTPGISFVRETREDVI